MQRMRMLASISKLNRVLASSWPKIAYSRSSASRWLSSAPHMAANAHAYANAPANAAVIAPNSSAFQYKTTPELTRALAVLQLSQWSWLVRHSDTLLKTAYRVVGTRMTDAVLRATFFGHFCAGENAVAIQPVIARLQQAGIGAILDYAVEADVGKENVTSDHCGSVEEMACDANAKLSLEMITDAGARKNATEPAFAAIKSTSLVHPELLMRLSSVLQETQRQVDAVCHQHSEASLSVEDLGRAFKLTDGQIKDLRGRVQPSAISGTKADKSSIDNDRNARRIYCDPVSVGAIVTPPLIAASLNLEEQGQLERGVKRLELLASKAAQCNVKLMIDAEQSYLQPAIDYMTLNLQRQFNRGTNDVIYNTFQCYLRDSGSRIDRDLEMARREGFCFACKLVRGAYMVQERQRAQELGCDDPIHPTREATHENYHAQVEKLLHASDHARFMVASHNETSVDHVVSLMTKLQRDRQSSGVSFGQLLGMSDHVSYKLGAERFQVFKYVPYGPIAEVLPYLVRRAQENSGMLGSAKQEMQMIKQELWRRLLGKKPQLKNN